MAEPDRLGDKFDRGDILFFYPLTLPEKIICFFSGNYCHCAVAISDGQCLSMAIKGARIDVIQDFGHRYDVYRLPEDAETETLIKFLTLLMFLVRYDLLGALKTVFKFLPNKLKNTNCAEFLVMGFYYIGLIPDKPNCTPQELANQWFLQKVENE